jgi:hypothetical protein
MDASAILGMYCKMGLMLVSVDKVNRGLLITINHIFTEKELS